MGDCPKKYLQFHDEEDEIAKEYKTGTTTKVKTPDGQLLWPWDERFRVAGTIGTGTNTHEVPNDCEEVEVKFTEIYSTLEEFASDYHGFKKRDPDVGRYGYWENPNRKWDWYKVGGRWTGFFPLKPNATGEVGSPGLMTPEPKPGYADQARLCDIDIERARDEAEKEARELFASWRSCFEKHGKAESFKQIRDRLTNEQKDSSLIEISDAARKLYHAQPAIQAFKEQDKHFFMEPVSDLGYSEEEYVHQRRDRALTTFAVVKDGKWYEKSEMGWWGVTHNEKMSQEEWNKNFANLLDNLHPETMLTVVDCHI